MEEATLARRADGSNISPPPPGLPPLQGRAPGVLGPAGAGLGSGGGGGFPQTFGMRPQQHLGDPLDRTILTPIGGGAESTDLLVRRPTQTQPSPQPPLHPRPRPGRLLCPPIR